VVTGSSWHGKHPAWGYNVRNAVTRGKDSQGMASMHARRRTSESEPSGNRGRILSCDSPTTTYTTNAVNQYTATAAPAETFLYTDGSGNGDGNLLRDGSFSYSWDAENRLIAIQTRVDLGASSTNPDSGDRQLLFTYDYMSRRVQKEYRVYNGTAWVTQAGYPQRYVYDGWNVVLVLNGGSSNATTQ